MKTCQCAVDVARVDFHCSIISDRVMPCKESIGEFRDWQPEGISPDRTGLRGERQRGCHGTASALILAVAFVLVARAPCGDPEQASDLGILSTCFTEAGAVS